MVTRTIIERISGVPARERKERHIAGQMAELRVALEGERVAIETFSVRRPSGAAGEVRAGAMFRAETWPVRRHPERFRALRPDEIDARIRSAERRARSAAGID